MRQAAKNITRWTLHATIGLLWVILYATTAGRILWELATYFWTLMGQALSKVAQLTFF